VTTSQAASRADANSALSLSRAPVTTELKSPSMADHEFYSDVLGGEDDDDDPDDMMSKIKTLLRDVLLQ